MKAWLTKGAAASMLIGVCCGDALASQVNVPDPDGNASDGFGDVVALLANGNFVVTAPLSGKNNSDVGAVFLFDGTKLTVLQTIRGSESYDEVGGGGIVPLPNGNFLILSPTWHNGVGAVTWVNGKGGALETVSVANSLIGDAEGDMVGFGQPADDPNYVPDVIVLANGDYVVGSPSWHGGLGAATWGSAGSGIKGRVGAANSLVGSLSADEVGSIGTIVTLKSGGYVVVTPTWKQNIGAATFSKGNPGVKGTITSKNSLIGSTSGDSVGSGGITVLKNDNFVISSPMWSDMGAATWASGTKGIQGVLSSKNSLVGVLSNPYNNGNCGAVTALANGNYVVTSPCYEIQNIGMVGAATFGNGSEGIIGEVSSKNSLLGTQSQGSDQVGGGGIIPLTSGDYVVLSPGWNQSRGAATWVSGKSSMTGTVNAKNSLVGGAGDQVGSGGGTALTNGNYVVASPNWASERGAVTFLRGGHISAETVSNKNSLIGGSASGQGSGGDNVGSGGVTALTNGNYVVLSPKWNLSAGAATWGSGTAGVAGRVASKNSLTGNFGGDQVGVGLGYPGITALSNGNYVVVSPHWNNDIGAATWGSGKTGVSGEISTKNSLVGSQNGDSVGSSGVMPLSNGAYVVASLSVGAITWGSAAAGIKGIVSSSNSLTNAGNSYGVAGSCGNVVFACGGVVALAAGAYAVQNSTSLTYGPAHGILGEPSATNSLEGVYYFWGQDSKGRVFGSNVPGSDNLGQVSIWTP